MGKASAVESLYGLQTVPILPGLNLILIPGFWKAVLEPHTPGKLLDGFPKGKPLDRHIEG